MPDLPDWLWILGSRGHFSPGGSWGPWKGLLVLEKEQGSGSLNANLTCQVGGQWLYGSRWDDSTCPPDAVPSLQVPNKW